MFINSRLKATIIIIIIIIIITFILIQEKVLLSHF